jgi:hypothetical protein
MEHGFEGECEEIMRHLAGGTDQVGEEGDLFGASLAFRGTHCHQQLRLVAQVVRLHRFLIKPVLKLILMMDLAVCRGWL